MENSVKPNFVEQEVIKGKITYFVNLNIELVGEMYRYEPIKVEYDRWEYGGIIDALVTHKYPNDKMQSVINNYLLDPTDETIIKEFNDMQAWRKEAKGIAKQALEYGVS